MLEFGDPRLPVRFWEKVELVPECSCWLWSACLSWNGYGQFRWLGQARLAHTVIAEAAFGAKPKGFDTDHLCRRRLCVNPRHLEYVPRAENIRRAWGGPWEGRQT